MERENEHQQDQRGQLVPAAGKARADEPAPARPSFLSSSPPPMPRALGAFIVDSYGTVLAFDAELEELTGWDAREVVGRPRELGLHLRGDDSPLAALRARPLFEGALDAPGETTSLVIHQRDGGRLEVEARVTPIGAAGERLAIEIQRIVSRQPREGSEEGRLLDPLTQLPGDQTFGEALRSALPRAAARGWPLALLLVQLDGSDDLAERYGGATWSSVIRRLADLLRGLASADQLLARVERSTFALLCESIGRGEARHVGGRIRREVERAGFGRLDGRGDLRATVSIGIACHPADGANEEELIRRASRALQEAHRLGRNRVWCYVRRPRQPFRTPIYFDGPSWQCLGLTRDISPSGLFIDTDERLPEGLRLGLRFRLPGDEDMVQLLGRVTRSDASQGLAVEFVHFSEETRRRLERFLRAR
jgi:diguanylate cyclase (GGDEF)-like protein/PAS domain S-box-containing protein